jgi:hypothetical protein
VLQEPPHELLGRESHGGRHARVSFATLFVAEPELSDSDGSICTNPLDAKDCCSSHHTPEGMQSSHRKPFHLKFLAHLFTIESLKSASRNNPAIRWFDVTETAVGEIEQVVRAEIQP